MKKDLVQLIKDNPNAVAIIDNYSWSLHKQHPYEENPYDEETQFDAYEKWQEENKIADDDTIESLGDGGHGSGNCYGGDILQALAKVVGLRVESV